MDCKERQEGGRVMDKAKSWINFARYTSPPIGKGRINTCEFVDDEQAQEVEHLNGALFMDIQVNGKRYTGFLYDIENKKEEEE
tara:strand:+ start:517 stop:765 length:249 start_codon:yes stop_codon:yes gene_type:complete